MYGYTGYFGLDINPERMPTDVALKISMDAIRSANDRINDLDHEAIVYAQTHPDETRGWLEAYMVRARAPHPDRLPPPRRRQALGHSLTERHEMTDRIPEHRHQPPQIPGAAPSSLQSADWGMGAGVGPSHQPALAGASSIHRRLTRARATIRPATSARATHVPAGNQNPAYTGTYVFTNDFPALLPDTSEQVSAPHPLLRGQTESGTCRVICFSPRHDLTLPEMPPAAIRAVVDAWVAQVEELGSRYRWVQVFENKGALMGCSNPHPHGQVWAGSALPNEPAAEDLRQRRYLDDQGSCLLTDYAEVEASHGERVVVENAEWLAVVPFWAVWPFEMLLLPRRRVSRLTDLTLDERDSLAAILKRLLTRYDNLFETSFPYSMGWHGAPN